jgi:hypothetical protein
MTQPGSEITPQPGWWVRTDRVGVGSGNYGWASHAQGAAPTLDSGTLAAALLSLKTSLTAAEIFSGTIAAPLKASTAALTGAEYPKGTVSGLLGQSTASFVGSGATIAASLIKPSAALTGAMVATYGSTGAATTGYGASFSWAHTVVGNCLVVGLDAQATSFYPQLTVQVGTKTMQQAGPANLYYSSGGTLILSYLFVLLNAPTGSQTITVTSDQNIYLAGNSVSYNNASGFGAPAITNGVSASASQAVSAAVGQMVPQVFGSSASNFSTYNQTQRYKVNAVGGVNTPFLMGDAPGASTVTFSSTLAASDSWGSTAVPLALTLSPSFDASGGGWAGGGSPSWAHTINGNAIVLPILLYSTSSTFPTVTAKVGATSMTLLGGWTAAGGYGYDGADYMYLPVFGLLSPPQGAQTITVTVPSGLVTANSLSYKNVSSFGTIAKTSGTGSSSFAVSASSAGGQMVVNAFGGYTGAINNYSQQRRSLQPYAGSTNLAMVAGDALGAPTTNFTAASTAADYWGGVTLPLLP